LRKNRIFQKKKRVNMIEGEGNIQRSQFLPEAYRSAEEVALFLLVHPKTILRMAREGKIPAHPFGDGRRRRWRFLISEVDAYMRERLNSSDRPCRVEGDLL
jgi:excisionase family DNA binding protein